MSVTISEIKSREILDSRGNPTVEVDVHLSDGSMGRASVPSGASTGSHEVLELRDNDPARFSGKGVSQATQNIGEKITPLLIGKSATNQQELDQSIIELDGTDNLSELGANAVLAVSLAVSKAAAQSEKLPYYQYLNRVFKSIAPDLGNTTYKLPTPMFNIINGGAHTNWQSTNVQEFMVLPVGAASFSEAYRWGAEIYQSLKKELIAMGFPTSVGDEGGFAPALENDQVALDVITRAVEAAGYSFDTQIKLGLDIAASEWMTDQGTYYLPQTKETLSTEDLINRWQEWVQKYPLISVEDGLDEDDWQGWQNLTNQLPSNVMVVGDDFLVTNPERIQKAIDQNACNTLLMKVNQIGSLTRAMEAIATAKRAGWKVVVSHRSGETEDTSIADIAVGTGSDFLKAGSLARSERNAKYNQVLRIEEELTR